MADVWKRFSLQAIGYPYCIFSLVDTSVQDFKIKWLEIVSTLSACEQCVDIEFSSALLRLFNTPETDNFAEWSQLHSKVTSLLDEVATCCPLNTESVENKHAISQELFGKTRGQLKMLTTAVETSFVDSITRSYAKLSRHVKDQEQPVMLQPALSRLGTRSRGAYSQPNGIFRTAEKRPREERVAAAQQKKFRRMSGSACLV
jgi:hypothetical protein